MQAGRAPQITGRFRHSFLNVRSQAAYDLETIMMRALQGCRQGVYPWTPGTPEECHLHVESMFVTDTRPARSLLLYGFYQGACDAPVVIISFDHHGLKIIEGRKQKIRIGSQVTPGE